MASEWLSCPLAEACASIDYGLTASTAEHNRGPKFLRITDIVRGHVDWNSVPHVEADEATFTKYQLRDGDIVLARTGASTGASAYIKNPPRAVFASYLVRLQAKPSFDARFLSYYLKSGTFWDFIRAVLGDKSAQPNASASTMTKAPLQAPRDKEEQRAIAHILGTLDDKIELNRRMNKTLEAIARAIFKSWFVDFDPVRAKSSGESPESICRRLGLTRELLAHFSDRLVDSEFGEIPEGWEVDGLESLASLMTTSISPAAQPEAVFEHYSIPAFDAAATPTYDLGSTIKSNKYVVSPLAVLVSKLNPETSRVWLPAVKTARAVCSTEFMQFVPRSAATRAYLYLTMCSERMQAEILKRVTGSTGSRQRTQPSQIATLPVLAPRDSVVESFDKIAAPLLALVARNREQSQSLGTFRDTLLPKLLSGELRVPLQGAA